MRYKIFILPGMLCACLFLHAQVDRIIPEPVRLVPESGHFEFGRITNIYAAKSNPLLKEVIMLFTRQFRVASGNDFILKEESPGVQFNGIWISLDSSLKSFGKEAYSLNVSATVIRINAVSEAGVFYALETLRQLLPADYYRSSQTAAIEWRVPCVSILDYPQFAYRGMHLDVSRHFFGVDFIKKYIDLLAQFKINVFHWHLTDSHGLRLEIKQYPKLTSVGAWRADRAGVPMTIAAATQPGEKTDYGGFYTQEQVKDIIRYAATRFISIIPEIEMPGHCTAALVAYPQFADLNNPAPLQIPCGYPGDLKHNFCAGYDSTYIFLQNILKEVMALFPSPYIHIGGDEVRGEPWLSCSRCQAKMKEEGFTNARQLQAYFTSRMDRFITAHGKRMMGWDEILEADIARSSVGMSWHGASKALEAAAKGNEVVMTPYWYTYFDFYQSDPALEPDITYARLQLDRVYQFKVIPDGFTHEQARYILGGQGCLWTENVETPARVEYMTLPRLLALSEVFWSPDSCRNYKRFIKKVESGFPAFQFSGINYAKSMYNTGIEPAAVPGSKTIRVALNDQTRQYQIRYTLDGTTPGGNSPLYKEPLTIDHTARLKTALFNESARLGKINTDTFTIHAAFGRLLISRPADSIYQKLTDGVYGTIDPYDGRWQLITDSVIRFVIDLKEIKKPDSIHLRFMEDQVGDIYLPRSIQVSVGTDSTKYQTIHTFYNQKIPQQLLRHIETCRVAIARPCRYIRVEIRNAGLNKTAERNNMLMDEMVIQ